MAAKLPAWLATKALDPRHREQSKTRSRPVHLAGGNAAHPPGEGRQPARFENFDVDKPILIFIHGAASSTRGSFGAFLTEDAQPQWQALTRLFGDHIYAFEHRTLSDSPIDNAIDTGDAAAAMPASTSSRIRVAAWSATSSRLTSIGADLLTRFDRGDRVGESRHPRPPATGTARGADR